MNPARVCSPEGGRGGCRVVWPDSAAEGRACLLGEGQNHCLDERTER